MGNNKNKNGKRVNTKGNAKGAARQSSSNKLNRLGRDVYGDVASVPRDLYNVVNQVYKMKQVVDFTTIASTATTPAFGAFQFKFSDLDQSTVLASLFDQYKLDFVEVIFRPNANIEAVGSPTSNIMPVLYTAIDYDDANALTTLGQIREYQSCKETRFDKDCHRKIKPRMAIAAYSGAFTSFANSNAMWIDAASTGVAHFGVKWALSAVLTGQSNLQTWTVEAYYYLSFRQVR